MRCHAQLVFVVGHHLGELELDVVRVFRLAPDVAQRFRGLLELTFLDKVTGRLREHEQANAEDQSWDELDRHGYPVGAAVHEVLGTVIHTVGDQHACRAD